MDPLEQLSHALADRLAVASPAVVTLDAGDRHGSGMVWRPDVVVASAESMGEQTSVLVRMGEAKIPALRVGSDPTTNVAVFRPETPLPGALPPLASGQPKVGALAMIVGADARGMPTGRLAMVHETGPAWHGMAGGLIDSLLRLDARIGADEGGLVLDASGALLGMAVAGPGRRALVIPAATLGRVVDPLLSKGRIARGWLGVGLQSVAIAEKFRERAGQARGAMVLQLAAKGPAETAGVLPGDILLSLDGQAFGRGRRIAALMTPERTGHTVIARILRGADIKQIDVTIEERPEA